MSSRIRTSLESHIYGNGDLGIELNGGCLCGIQSVEYSHMHPYNLVKTRSKRGSSETRSP